MKTLFVLLFLSSILIELIRHRQTKVLKERLFHLEDVLTSPEYEEEEEEEYSAVRDKIFDCPECASVAEVAAITIFVSDDITELYYIISCLGDHEIFSVDADWFHNNVALD